MVLRFKNLMRWIGPLFLFLLLLLARGCIANNIAKDELILLLEEKFSQIQTYECNMKLSIKIKNLYLRSQG